MSREVRPLENPTGKVYVEDLLVINGTPEGRQVIEAVLNLLNAENMAASRNAIGAAAATHTHIVSELRRTHSDFPYQDFPLSPIMAEMLNAVDNSEVVSALSSLSITQATYVENIKFNYGTQTETDYRPVSAVIQALLGALDEEGARESINAASSDHEHAATSWNELLDKPNSYTPALS